MRVILFDDLSVEVASRTSKIGQIYLESANKRRAEGASALRWIYEQAQQIEKPVLFDVGAHTGTFSLLAAHHPGMTVYAFEPLRKVYNQLVKNVRLNGLEERVHCFPIALGSKDCTATLSVPKRITHWSLATLGVPKRFSDVETVQVHVRTLDGWMEKHGPDHIDLMKIDTEGHELAILAGGEQTIRTHRPIVLSEYQDINTEQFGYKKEKIRTRLESWGATCEFLPPRDLKVTWNG